jgi:WD40 repeat protein
VRPSESRIVDLAVSIAGPIASVDTAGRVGVWSSELEPRARFSAASAGDREALRWDFGYAVRFTRAASGLVVAGPTTMSLRDLDGASRWSAALDRVDLAPPVAAGDRILVVVCTERGRGVTIGSTTSCYDSRIDIHGPDGQLRAALSAPGGVETMFRLVDATPDGERIAALSADGRVLLWTGRGDFIGEVSRGANALAFSPDGARLAVGKAGGLVEVHAIWPDIDALVREARRRLDRAGSGT